MTDIQMEWKWARAWAGSELKLSQKTTHAFKMAETERWDLDDSSLAETTENKK